MAKARLISQKCIEAILMYEDQLCQKWEYHQKEDKCADYQDRNQLENLMSKQQQRTGLQNTKTFFWEKPCRELEFFYLYFFVFPLHLKTTHTSPFTTSLSSMKQRKYILNDFNF